MTPFNGEDLRQGDDNGAGWRDSEHLEPPDRETMVALEQRRAFRPRGDQIRPYRQHPKQSHARELS